MNPSSFVCLCLLAVLASPAASGGTAEPARPSSFRACGPNAPAPGGCDQGEACDFTQYDVYCIADACEMPQTGDRRCHRICMDNACGPGETCVERTLTVSDTGQSGLRLCLCAGKACPERGPGALPRPAEGGLALWRPERAMPMALHAHAAASSAKRLYVSGGWSIQNTGPLAGCRASNRKVFSAPFRAEGKLGAWEESGVLPEPLGEHGMAVVAGRLFIAGGAGEWGAFTGMVRSAPLREDGSLGPWREEASLPTPRSSPSLVAHENTLWVIGGTVTPGHHQGTRDLWRAKLSSEGEARVGHWETLESPERLHDEQGVAVAKGRLYAVQEDGRPVSVALDTGAPWRKELAPPRTQQVDFGQPRPHDFRLRVLPGMILALLPHGLVLTADLGTDGIVSPWRWASRLYNPDSGFATAVGPGGDRVYVLGGLNEKHPMRSIADVGSTTRLAP